MVTVVNKNMCGIVRFLGPTQFAEGVWVGVELDQAVGKNDGSVNGVRYFKCAAARGIFVRPSQVKPNEVPIRILQTHRGSPLDSIRGSTCGSTGGSTRASSASVLRRKSVNDRSKLSSSSGNRSSVQHKDVSPIATFAFLTLGQPHQVVARLNNSGTWQVELDGAVGTKYMSTPSKDSSATIDFYIPSHVGFLRFAAGFEARMQSDGQAWDCSLTVNKIPITVSWSSSHDDLQFADSVEVVARPPPIVSENPESVLPSLVSQAPVFPATFLKSARILAGAYASATSRFDEAGLVACKHSTSPKFKRLSSSEVVHASYSEEDSALRRRATSRFPKMRKPTSSPAHHGEHHEPMELLEDDNEGVLADVEEEKESEEDEGSTVDEEKTEDRTANGYDESGELTPDTSFEQEYFAAGCKFRKRGDRGVDDCFVAAGSGEIDELVNCATMEVANLSDIINRLSMAIDSAVLRETRSWNQWERSCHRRCVSQVAQTSDNLTLPSELWLSQVSERLEVRLASHLQETLENAITAAIAEPLAQMRLAGTEIEQGNVNVNVNGNQLRI